MTGWEHFGFDSGTIIFSDMALVLAQKANQMKFHLIPNLEKDNDKVVKT